MSIVIKVNIESEEQTILNTIINIKNLNEKILCTRTIESSYDISSDITTKYSLYIFSMKDVDICKEILKQCAENKSFKVDNIIIETRINKQDVL